ncbi:MAG TPA: hypothetical protein ENH62_06120 [Marinobacter sp.]|uniref:Uncharacterized protein n=1 Tax=marine sediment metagenome TaxID=412755 RepID=A0A0F9U414_9ZZZZ|nr:hypothetical protein [Marinobacter sp.]
MPVLGAGYIGDYTEDYATLNLKFTSYSTIWVPTVLAGAPVVKVYAANETGTEVTTGITLSVDFDGVAGLNNVLVDLSSAAFYAVAKDYHVIITTGTIDSVSAIGTVIGSFSIENRFDAVDEIVDAVWAQAMTELGSVPGVTGTTLAALEWLFLLARNKGDQTSTTKKLYADDGSTVIATSAISDDGATFTRGEWS